MKSMEMEFHGFSGIGSCLSLPYGLWRGALVHAQFIHELMYVFTMHPKPGQWKFHLMSLMVFVCLKWPAVGWSWWLQMIWRQRSWWSGTYSQPSKESLSECRLQLLGGSAVVSFSLTDCAKGSFMVVEEMTSRMV